MTYDFSDIVVSNNSSVSSIMTDKARSKRNDLLAETDWWAVQDRTMSQEEATYRQALRDIPAQAGFPDAVTWPVKP